MADKRAQYLALNDHELIRRIPKTYVSPQLARGKVRSSTDIQDNFNSTIRKLLYRLNNRTVINVGISFSEIPKEVGNSIKLRGHFLLIFVHIVYLKNKLFLKEKSHMSVVNKLQVLHFMIEKEACRTACSIFNWHPDNMSNLETVVTYWMPIVPYGTSSSLPSGKPNADNRRTSYCRIHPTLHSERPRHIRHLPTHLVSSESGKAIARPRCIFPIVINTECHRCCSIREIPNPKRGRKGCRFGILGPFLISSQYNTWRDVTWVVLHSLLLYCAVLYSTVLRYDLDEIGMRSIGFRRSCCWILPKTVSDIIHMRALHTYGNI